MPQSIQRLALTCAIFVPSIGDQHRFICIDVRAPQSINRLLYQLNSKGNAWQRNHSKCCCWPLHCTAKRRTISPLLMQAAVSRPGVCAVVAGRASGRHSRRGVPRVACWVRVRVRVRSRRGVPRVFCWGAAGWRGAAHVDRRLHILRRPAGRDTRRRQRRQKESRTAAPLHML